MFIHKKAKKLVDVKSQENGVVTMVEFGKSDEISMKSGLFAKLFDEVTDEEAQKLMQEYNAAIDAKIATKIRNTAGAAKKVKQERIAMAETEDFKKLFEDTCVKNEYYLSESGQEVHEMKIVSNGQSLTYISHVKVNHKGISRTMLRFNDEVQVPYNNIGIDTVAEDFAPELGLSVDDLRMLLMTIRRSTISANRETYGLDVIEARKAAYNDQKNAARTSALAAKQEAAAARAAKKAESSEI